MKKVKQAILIMLCVGVFSALAIGSGITDEDASTEINVDEISSSEKIEGEASEVVSELESMQTEYYVGDTLAVEGMEITYTSSSNYISDNEFIQPAEGNRFIRLTFHIYNQFGPDRQVSAYGFVCYADGYEYQAIYQNEDLSASLSEGFSTDGAVYFEIPAEAKEIEVEYEIGLYYLEKVRFIFEGDEDCGFVFEEDKDSELIFLGNGDSVLVSEDGHTATDDAFRVGDIIETDSLRISYIEAEEYVSDNRFLQPADGMKYIYIKLEVENLSDSDQMISHFSFNCYADNMACDSFYYMDDTLSAELSAGRKAQGTVAFEVPADAQVIEIEFEDNFWTESKIIFLYE